MDRFRTRRGEDGRLIAYLPFRRWRGFIVPPEREDEFMAFEKLQAGALLALLAATGATAYLADATAAIVLFLAGLAALFAMGVAKTRGLPRSDRGLRFDAAMAGVPVWQMIAGIIVCWGAVAGVLYARRLVEPWLEKWQIGVMWALIAGTIFVAVVTTASYVRLISKRARPKAGP